MQTMWQVVSQKCSMVAQLHLLFLIVIPVVLPLQVEYLKQLRFNLLPFFQPDLLMLDNGYLQVEV